MSQIASPRWSSAVAGARTPPQTSAASPGSPVSRGARGPWRAVRAAGSRRRAQTRAQPCLASVGRQEELAGGQERRLGEGAHAALVGRIEGAQRLDLVAEPLDAHGQRLAGREDVDDAAAARELAAAGRPRHRLVAQAHEFGQDGLLAAAGPPLAAAAARAAGRRAAASAGRAPARSPRGRAGRRRCQAARAATRAALSSRTSSERS